MKLISVITTCYNEEQNVRDIYLEVKNLFDNSKHYVYEHIFIDNASTDETVSILKEISKEDKNVKIIVNTRNFGSSRSGQHALYQARGDAIVLIVADLQEPPPIILEFLTKWEEGYKIVVGIKNKSEENPILFLIRKLYYDVINRFSDTEQIKNFTGFGLYDKEIINLLKETVTDPHPYFRGLISELGHETAEVEFTQKKRKKGKSKHNFYSWYELAMLGFVNHSKVPLRIAAFIGFSVAILSLLLLAIYIIWKIVLWKETPLGMAPLIIGIFFFSAVQLFFIGVIGEYIGAIYTHVRNRPLVIEKERINFDL